MAKYTTMLWNFMNTIVGPEYTLLLRMNPLSVVNKFNMSKIYILYIVVYGSISSFSACSTSMQYIEPIEWVAWLA